MKKLNVAIIGLGYIGESHIEAVHRLGFCNLYGVYDANMETAKAKSEYYGIPKCYNSIEELLADPNVDAVHNCTPTMLHHKINCQILEAGKHLFSEKPLCTTKEEAEELIAVKAKHPELAAAVNFNYRMNPLVGEMKARIEAGEIGDVRIMQGSYLQDWLLYDTDYSWRLEKAVSGDSCAIADIGSHWMDAVQYVTGHKIVKVLADVETVIPVRKKPTKANLTFTSVVPTDFEEVQVENEDYAAVLFKTDKGARGVFCVSELCAGHGCYLNFEIDGSKAAFMWNQEENDRLWVGSRNGDNSLIIRNPNSLSPSAKEFTSLAKGHPEGWNDAFKGNMWAFYKYIDGGLQGTPCFATLEDAAHLVALTEAILLSSKEERWVEVK
ncbi:MAG: Gfo/Idh/MocA family oxidoreductase [Clostridia bacterium]|nr:Gfo/Idh/MocA family oxidoreductase [Clostridia bacterium]